MLGFGASGHDLEEKWSLKYLGTEMVDGVKTDKLELVAKDPTVRQNIPKVTIWLDTARAVSLKQVFDEKDGTSRTCHYTSIKVNQTLPSGAFSFDK
jgi:outer membrane lipoprotein-sorting protein